MSSSVPAVRFGEFLTPNKRPYLLGDDEDADLVGMRLYGLGPFHRELKLAAKIQKKSHFVIRAGDVIYNKLFAWRGTFGIVSDALDGMFVSDKFPTYQLDTERVDPRYLGWYFRYPPLWDQAKRMSTGSAALSKLTLNPPRFMDLTMPLPDLAGQVQVVEKLDRYSSSLRRVDTIRKLIAPQTQALLTVLIETKLQRLEKRYPMQPLSSVVDQTRGISYGVVQTGTEYDGGVPTLRAGDVRQFEILLGNVKRVDPGIEAKYQRTRLRGGEVLLRIRGGLGETAVCPTEMVGGNVSREVAVIPVTEALDPTYVMYGIAAPSRQEFLRSNLRGTSYVGINLKDVRRLELPVPPLGVQSKFVQEIASLRRRLSDIETEQQAASDLTEALLPSLLAEAFAASNGS